MTLSENITLAFYRKDKLNTLTAKASKRTIFHSTNHILAELNNLNNSESALLATDLANSVLTVEGFGNREEHTYSAYGFSASQPSNLINIGFNGNHMDNAAKIYLLGLGYRGYSSNRFRFLSPDNLSPFGLGGMNAYSYCAGDPINRSDPTGHSWLSRLFKPSKSKHSAYLKNHYPELLRKEISLVKAHTKTTGDPRRIVKTGTDLTSVGIGVEVKFVINKNNEMAVSISGGKGSSSYTSHPSIANILPNTKIISSGTMIIGSLGDVFLYNRSGHYRPTMEHLAPAITKLRTLGFEPSAHSYNQ
ncbi:RHS repeat-associated core domain-containing protein [Pseudomonas sp. SAR267]|uniref:RHS repeat-associated core domain-containing protein n=1 Tax=unclassified Pseudomonas TaxID=196821 RepID=UPI0028A5C740|nr:RHS repeat-associated core domain-containing protein [Pseudomonas sp.]